MDKSIPPLSHNPATLRFLASRLGIACQGSDDELYSIVSNALSEAPIETTPVFVAPGGEPTPILDRAFVPVRGDTPSSACLFASARGLLGSMQDAVTNTSAASLCADNHAGNGSTKANEPISSERSESIQAEAPASFDKPRRVVSARVAGKDGEDGEDGEESAVIGVCEGIFEMVSQGYGFIRVDFRSNSPKDAYVPGNIMRAYDLRPGDKVLAEVKAGKPGKPNAACRVLTRNGYTAEQLAERPVFERLTPVFPNERFRFETGKRNELAMRCIDLVCPIGKGQRAMIVSPPKAGKTTLLKMLATSIGINHPETKVLILLVDERPEEVTDIRRSVKGEVYDSTFDEECEHHIAVSELVLERAKRLAEEGEDVVVLLDSLTRMTRASNVVCPTSGKTLSGGLDPVALYFPKRFFGAARNFEEKGSLTIIATALVDTGSRMDDMVYEEFKGTGNMEVHLDRRLSERRIFPAIDLFRSGTRKEELLLNQKELAGEMNLRRFLANGDPQEASTMLLTMLAAQPTNMDFLADLELRLARLRKNS